MDGLNQPLLLEAHPLRLVRCSDEFSCFKRHNFNTFRTKDFIGICCRNVLTTSHKSHNIDRGWPIRHGEEAHISRYWLMSQRVDLLRLSRASPRPVAWLWLP